MSVSDGHLLGIRETQNAAATAALVIAGIAGAAWYIMAQRIYQSNASLLIVRIGTGVTEDTAHNNGSPNNDMPTFIEIMSRDEVISRALKQLPEKYRVDLKGYPETQWIRLIRDNLSVSSAYATNLLDMSYQSKDPKAAAAVLAHMLMAYKQFLDETHQGSSIDNLRMLNEKLVQISEQLESLTQQRLQLKASAPELVDTGDKTTSLSVVSETIKLLAAEYAVARKETEESRTKADALKRAINNGEDILQFALETLDSAGRQLIENSMGLGSTDALHVQRINQELLDLRSELRDASLKYGVNHPKMVALNDEILVKESYLQQLPTLQRQRMDEMARTELGPRLSQYLNQQLQKNEANERAISARLNAEQAKAQILTQTLTRLADLDREIERLYTQQSELQNFSDGISLNKDTFIRTEIASKPSVPTRPVSPRLATTGILSLMLGTICGLLIIWVLDILDDRFRTPEELKMQLETQVLSMIPRMDELPGEGFEAVMCHTRPHSKEVEAFRSLRTSIEFSPQETNRLLCTSTEPGDGKTTVSSNLAVAFAQSGRRTLLIDADMRRPGLSTLLGLRDDVGLSRILRDNEDLADSIEKNLRTSIVPGLDVISCGPRPVNPAELLAADRFSNLLAWAETRYEQIIVDAPPVLAVSDPAIVGRLVDAVVGRSP